MGGAATSCLVATRSGTSLKLPTDIYATLPSNASGGRGVCVHKGPPGSRNVISCRKRYPGFLGLQLAGILITFGNVVPPVSFVFGQICFIVPNILFGRVDLFLRLSSACIIFFRSFQVPVLNSAFFLSAIGIALGSLFVELGPVGL